MNKEANEVGYLRRPGLNSMLSNASILTPTAAAGTMTQQQTNTASSYLVVILAGPGEGLFPLINNEPTNRDEPDQQRFLSSSKATLPLLNRPMVEFILDWVEDSGLTDVLILASESQRHCLNSMSKSRKSSSSSSTNLNSNQPIQIKLECIPDLEFINHGTCGSLRWAIQRNLIKTAFVVLPCDLYFEIPTSNNLDQSLEKLKYPQVDPIYKRNLLAIVERHRTNQNLITSVFYERQANSLDLKEGPIVNLVTLDPRSGVLLNMKELDGYGSEVEIRMKMINQFPTSILSSSLVPAHIFVCSPAVIDLLLGLPQLASFKHQFVPWLAKNQWQPGLLEKTTLATTKLDITRDPLTEALQRSSTNPDPTANKSELIKKGIRTPITAASTPPISRTFSCLSLETYPEHIILNPPLSHKNLESALKKTSDPSGAAFRCEYIIWRASDGFVCRANSVAGFSEINRTALKLTQHQRSLSSTTTTRPPTGPPPLLGSAGGTSGPDSLIAPNVLLADKSSVKKSIIGPFSIIGKSSKVVNSVIMDKVVLGEHVKIDNCIIANHVQIADRVELKDCEVESGTVIESDFVTKGEKIARC